MKEPLNIEIHNYDKKLEKLVGQYISDINYYEIDYGEPSWDEKEYHSIDYGLQISTSNDEEYYFIWDSQYFSHDLKFDKGDINVEFSNNENLAIWNVVDNVKWKKLIGIKIAKVKSNWSYVTYDENNKKIYFPQNVLIEFVNGEKIIISVLEISDNILLDQQDNLTIIFEETTIKKYGIVP